MSKNKHIANGGKYTGITIIDELDEALYGFTDEQKLKLFDDAMPKLESRVKLKLPLIIGTVGGVDIYDGSTVRWQDIDEAGQYKNKQ